MSEYTSIKEKGKVYLRVFSTPDGKRVLKDMVDNFMRQELFDGDPLLMAKKVGQHDLVQYISEITQAGKKDE